MERTKKSSLARQSSTLAQIHSVFPHSELKCHLLDINLRVRSVIASGKSGDFDVAVVETSFDELRKSSIPPPLLRDYITAVRCIIVGPDGVRPSRMVAMYDATLQAVLSFVHEFVRE